MLEEKKAVYARHDSLIPDAVMTFPSKERSNISVTAYAGGVALPEAISGGHEEDRERFLSECTGRGIIPFSVITWRYDHERARAVPVFFDVNELRNHPGQQRRVLEQIIKGGRFHTQHFEEMPLDVFVETQLFLQLAEDYALVQGRLRTVNDQYGSIRIESSFSFMTLRDEIQLAVQGNSNGTSSSPIMEWFDGLDSRDHDLRK